MAETLNPIADQILDQLMQTHSGAGRSKAALAVNARQFTSTDAGVRFDFRGSKSWNGIEITLNHDGQHDVQFWKTGNGPTRYSAVRRNVPSDELQQVFEQETGLLTSLPGTTG